jgi:nicotinate-nucleotide adenylyltransferase
MSKIGIFGGTFDPPHLGHLILASEALEQLKLDHLLWMMTAMPPHKEALGITPLEQRLELTRAAIAGFSQFELSTLEIDRPGPHYSVDTVALVKQAQPDAEIYFLMGEDSLRDLPGWHEPERMIAMCDGLGIMRRPGSEAMLQELEFSFPNIQQKVIWFNTPMVEISSHDIRQRIREMRTYQFFIPEAVYKLIDEKKYYLK